MTHQQTDVVVIGAGAAGLMCAREAGYRGRSVRIIDHAPKAGRKILMSGGGRCNFTNTNTGPEYFLSNNPAFCISALARFTAHDFLELVERHGVEYVEKAPGQLFCQHKAKDLLNMLLTENQWAGTEITLKTNVTAISRSEPGFVITTDHETLHCESLVIATGGLSIPTMGASPFGYRVAEQFGIPVLPTRAGLVPFTLHPPDKALFADLAGVSLPVCVQCRGHTFCEPMLFTHRGLSGPAMLQISSFWQPGDALEINFLPQLDLIEWVTEQRNNNPKRQLHNLLADYLPRRVVELFANQQINLREPLGHFSKAELETLSTQLHHWQITPAGTEGYRTAEVTLGGVDTQAISSKTMQAKQVPGLFFIGEVLDVTGALGGHNFQWAWASGVAAGSVV